MIKYYSIASSSKGNCYLVKTPTRNILIDAGISAAKIKKSLKELNVFDLDAVIVTHEHSDHCKGLKIHEEFNAKVYLKLDSYEVLKEKYYFENFETIQSEFKIGDIHFNVIDLMHDAASHFGLEIIYEDKNIIHITDTGYLKKEIIEKYKNATLYVIESNYDSEMLMESERPHFLKKRIISDTGHLDNLQTARYLKELVGERTVGVAFAHLSESVNTPELVLAANKNLNKKKSFCDPACITYIEI